MPLIKQKIKSKMIPISIKLPEDLVVEMKAYCQFASIDQVADYIEQSAYYVLTKDKAFQSWKREKTNT